MTKPLPNRGTPTETGSRPRTPRPLLLLLLALLPLWAAQAQTDPRDHTAVGGTTYFTATTPEHGRELWKTDESGTAMVQDFFPGPESSDPNSFRVMEGSLYFLATVQESADTEEFPPIRSLYRTSPDAGGVQELKRFSIRFYGGEQGMPVGNLTVVGDILYLSSGHPNDERGLLISTLWKITGGLDSPVALRELTGSYFQSSGMGNFHGVNGLLVFTHEEYDRDGNFLWGSDGTPEGTYQIKYFAELSSFYKENGLLYFTNSSDGYYFPEFPEELWRTDGTREGTFEVADPCPNLGSILREYWAGLPRNDNGVDAIPLSTLPTATSLLPSFEGPANVADGYGSRIRGFICPPQTGEYTFWISGDNDVELWLSTDYSPANRRKIAEHIGFTAPRQWDKHPSQKSLPIRLEAGRRYYVEALHKEGAGGDHVAVAWTLPDGTFEAPIPGSRLSPFEPEQEYAPTVRITSPEEGQTFTIGEPITLTVEAEVLYSKIDNVSLSHIGWDFTAPFSFTFYLPAGTHQLGVLTVAANGKYTNQQITITVLPGTILREQWDGVPGTSVSSIPLQAAPSSTSQLASLEAPGRLGDNYGARLRGYVYPPQNSAETGYTFYISGDDDVELWLSTDDNPANKRLIAHPTGSTAPRDWHHYNTQRSAPVRLYIGRRYYIEVLHKEGGDNDHVSVAWRLPDGTFQGPIPGSALSPFVPEPACTASGTILREQWNNVRGSSLTAVPVDQAPSSSSQLTSFEGLRGAGDFYGSRVRGYICPPETGEYTFHVAGDNLADLYLSTDDDPANKVLVARLDRYTNFRQWDRDASQQSEPVLLEKGRRYYIEALHLEQAGGDHVSVAWTTPGGTFQGPIPGSVLSPFETTAATVAADELKGQGSELSAFPNPFTERTTLRFSLAEAGHASLEVYDMQGRLVRQLFSGSAEAGAAREFEFDGRELARGIYLAKLVTGSKVITRKIILNR